MNRRRFLQALAATPVAVALAPLAAKVLVAPEAAPPYVPRYVYGTLQIGDDLRAA